MTRILHLLGTARPEGTGIAHIVAGLASGLDRDRYRVNAWFLDGDGPLVEMLERAGATVRVMDWSRGVRDPAGMWRFLRLFNKDFGSAERILIHQHFGWRSVRRVARMSRGARVIVHLHAAPTSPVTDADCVIAASQAIAAAIPDARVIYPGVRLPALHERGKRNDIVIGAACRLVPMKGVDDLLKAVNLLTTEFPELRLEVAGEGPERDNLQSRAGDRTVFLGWRRDMDAVLRGWDIFAMPSHSEGFGIAVAEAMANSLPVVATRTGGLAEVVADGHTGFLTRAGDVSGLTSRLRELIVDARLRQAMGSAGRARAEALFSAERMVAATAAVYEELAFRGRSL